MIATRQGFDLTQKVRRFIRQNEMLLGNERILLAVSGGIDSMAMLDVLARIAPPMKISLAIAHFDHGLRGDESKKDAGFVVDEARKRGLRTYVARGDVARIAAQSKLSVEDAARRVRYQFLSRVARKNDYTIVMTAHTANDNAETVVMNLMRGAGVSGLAGIPPTRTLVDDVLLARPMLGVERHELLTYAEEVELLWREDDTNASTAYTRNRIRHELIPVLAEFNPSIISTLNSTAAIMRGLEQYLSHAVGLAVDKVLGGMNEERLELNIAQLKHYLPAIQTEVIQRLASKAFDIPPISYGAIERILGLLWKDPGAKTDVGAGIAALRDRDALLLLNEPPPPVPYERKFSLGESVQTDRFLLNTEVMDRRKVRFTRNSNIEYVDAGKIPETLLLRNWRDGDRFQPLGMTGEKKVSDFLTDIKVSVEKKKETLVIADGDTIIWVCGLRLDDRFKVTSATQTAVRFEVRRGMKGNSDE